MERWAVRPTGHLFERGGKVREHRLLNEHQGTLFWAVLGAGVALADMYGKETLSHAAERALNRNRYGKIATTAAIATVALHLTRSFDKVGIPDPMTTVVGRIRRRK